MALSMKIGPNFCKYLRKCILSRQFHLSNSICEKCVRVRFAPSPTGRLHLGSLRTALYNYLFAKSQNGKFVLRIEDTDQTRKIPGSIDDLTNILSWASLHPDEGPSVGGEYGPYIQSERLHLYKKHIETLVQNGTAYRCFCTPRRLELLRKEAVRNREIPKYDGRCRHLTEEEIQRKLTEGLEYVVRLKLIQLAEPFEDVVYGPIDIDLTENEGDPVLMKTDGYPTYHFANVVDDHLMKITHVLRGVEWQISTPKHLMLYQAFGWTPPQYAHLPLIMNKDGTKLSKRQGDIHVEHFMKLGYYPESLLNYITVPGGGFSKSDNEVLSLEELVKNFNIRSIKRNSGRVDPEHLDKINQTFLQRRIVDGRINELIDQVRHIVQRKYSDILLEDKQQDELTTEYLEQILKWSQDRITRLEDLVNSDFEFLWLIPKQIDIADINITDLPNVLQSCKECVENMMEFKQGYITTEMKKMCKERGIKFNVFMKCLRLCLTGLKEGPSIGEIMTLLGRSKTIERLENAKQICQEKQQSTIRS